MMRVPWFRGIKFPACCRLGESAGTKFYYTVLHALAESQHWVDCCRCCGGAETTNPDLSVCSIEESDQSDVMKNVDVDQEAQPQTQDGPANSPQQTAHDVGNGTTAPKRVYKMSDEFLMFKFKVGELTVARHTRNWPFVSCHVPTIGQPPCSH